VLVVVPHAQPAPPPGQDERLGRLPQAKAHRLVKPTDGTCGPSRRARARGSVCPEDASMR